MHIGKKTSISKEIKELGETTQFLLDTLNDSTDTVRGFERIKNYQY